MGPPGRDINKENRPYNLLGAFWIFLVHCALGVAGLKECAPPETIARAIARDAVHALALPNRAPHVHFQQGPARSSARSPSCGWFLFWGRFWADPRGKFQVFSCVCRVANFPCQFYVPSSPPSGAWFVLCFPQAHGKCVPPFF